MKEPKWCRIGIDMFHADVLVCVGSRTQMMESGAKFLKEHSGWSDDKIDGVGKSLAEKVPYGEDGQVCGEVFRVKTTGGLLYFIRLDSFVTTSQDIAILGHECLHAALALSRDLSIEETGGRECLCYLHEHIFRKALESLTVVSADVGEDNKPSNGDSPKRKDGFGVNFHVIDMGDGKFDATRSKVRADGFPLLTRKQLYKGRREAAQCEYAHAFMCGGFPEKYDPDRPSEEEWMSEAPHPFEVDQFVSEKLFGEAHA